MMTGRVDDYGRPLVAVTVYHPQMTVQTTFEAWIDTGFTGDLMLTQDQITLLGLPRSPSVVAKLADGTQVTFDSYACQVEWFGNRRPIDAIAGSGKFALIGLLLLEDCTLTIDYPARTVTLVLAPGALPTP